MLPFKPLILAAAVAAVPLLSAGEASADHRHHRYHHRYGCDVDRYVPSYRAGYRYGYPSIYSRYRAPLYGAPGFRYGNPYRYGAGYPFYGYRGTSLGLGPRGFSLYIGR